MTVTGVSRVAAKTRLFETIAGLGDLKLVALGTDTVTTQVTYTFPRTGLEQASVWLGAVTGSLDYPTMSAGRKRREDTFTIDVFA